MSKLLALAGIISIILFYGVMLRVLMSTDGWYKTSYQGYLDDVKKLANMLEISKKAFNTDVRYKKKYLYALLLKIRKKSSRWKFRTQDFPVNDGGNFLKLEDTYAELRSIFEMNQKLIDNFDIANPSDIIKIQGFLLNLESKLLIIKDCLEKHLGG